MLTPIVELVNTVNPEPVSEEAFRARKAREVPGRVRYTAVTVDEAGAIGGYVSIVRHPWMASGHFWVRVIVDPTLRRQGLGELLYHHTLDDLAHTVGYAPAQRSSRCLFRGSEVCAALWLYRPAPLVRLAPLSHWI